MTDEQPLPGWVPSACTLPTEQQPLRQAEFDALFAADLQTVHRIDPGSLVLILTGNADVARSAADLTKREAECCSFFGFTVTSGDSVELRVTVSPDHTAVLDALEARATALIVR